MNDENNMHQTESDDTRPNGGVIRARGVLLFLGRFEMFFASAAFVVICVVVTSNTVMRTFFNSSLVWSEEVAMLSVRIVVFFGAAVILKSNADLAITVFANKMPYLIRQVIKIATFSVASLFFFVIAIQCLYLWPIQKNGTTFILELNRYWYTAPLLYASCSMAGYSVYRAFEEIIAPEQPPIFEFSGEPE